MGNAGFLDKLHRFIRENQLFEEGEKLLCAVSGGLDSMVMAASLLELGYALEIAHVNFELRGEDSFLDEESVRNWSERNKLPFHLKRAGKAMKTGAGSLQEKARHFRYQWFENLAAERGITHLVLAHHTDDQAETILLQFFRGAGIDGLQGMKASSGLRRRPLLSFTKAELLSEANCKGIIWREDRSNETDDYLRNRVRHQLIPLLRELFPGFEKVLLRNAARMEHNAEGLEFLFGTLQQEFRQEEESIKDGYRLDLIRQHPLGVFFVRELLLKNGFTFSDSLDFAKGIGSNESRIKSNQHGDLAEMRYPRLLVGKEQPFDFNEIIISDANPQQWNLPDGRILVVEKLTAFNIKNEQQECIILQPAFPLTLRRWKAGDRMALEGMGGKKKKLSDLLSEAKRSSSEKANQLVLEDANGCILWLPGIRRAAEIHNSGAAGDGLVMLLKIS